MEPGVAVVLVVVVGVVGVGGMEGLAVVRARSFAGVSEPPSGTRPPPALLQRSQWGRLELKGYCWRKDWRNGTCRRRYRRWIGRYGERLGRGAAGVEKTGGAGHPRTGQESGNGSNRTLISERI